MRKLIAIFAALAAALTIAVTPAGAVLFGSPENADLTDGLSDGGSLHVWNCQR
jgi:hypothetical protein